MKLEQLNVPLIFGVLFPSGSLVGLNHFASSDAAQIAHILKLRADQKRAQFTDRLNS